MRSRNGIIIILMVLISLASIQALMISSVSTNPREIIPGETSIIKIALENEGNRDIEDVSVILNLADVPFAPYDSGSEYSIDKIREGKIKYAEFEIVALNNAKSGIYKIPLTITYNIGGEMQASKDSLISLTINSEPIIGVNIEDGLFLKGQENKLTIRIVNKGLSDVKFLEVELSESTYFNTLSQKNVYLGDIDSDDFDTAEFKIFFKKNIPNSINLPVKILYRDSLNNKYEKDFNIPLKVYTKKQAIELGLLKKDNTVTYIVIVVGLIIVWLIYRKIKGKKFKNN